MSRAVGTRPRTAPCPATRVEAMLLVALEVLMGVGALLGGRALIHDAADFGVKDEWLRFGVFNDYTAPGVILIVAVGGSMLIAALAALTRSPSAFPMASFAGATLLAFLVVETVILGYHGPRQLVLLTICGGAGLALVLLGRRGYR